MTPWHRLTNPFKGDDRGVLVINLSKNNSSNKNNSKILKDDHPSKRDHRFKMLDLSWQEDNLLIAVEVFLPDRYKILTLSREENRSQHYMFHWMIIQLCTVIKKSDDGHAHGILQTFQIPIRRKGEYKKEDGLERRSMSEEDSGRWMPRLLLICEIILFLLRVCRWTTSRRIEDDLCRGTLDRSVQARFILPT